MRGTTMFLATYVRMFLMICVPLFIILTGYLMCHKTLDRKYYSKAAKTLVLYLLASIVCLLFKIVFQHNSFSVGEAIEKIFDFSAAPYAWYIEMYIGLFLIIPFLNLAFYGLKIKKQRLTLVATCIFLTILPQNLKYLPNWWVSIYPICYYFTGCYLREYGLKLRRLAVVMILLASVLLGTLRTFICCYGRNFEWTGWNGHNSIAVYAASVMTFVLLSSFKYRWISGKLSKILGYISGLVLGAYLCSWILDEIVWKGQIIQSVPAIPRAALGVSLVFCGSLLLSVILNVLYWLLVKLAQGTKNLTCYTPFQIGKNMLK